MILSQVGLMGITNRRLAIMKKYMPPFRLWREKHRAKKAALKERYKPKGQ